MSLLDDGIDQCLRIGQRWQASRLSEPSADAVLVALAFPAEIVCAPQLPNPKVLVNTFVQ
jgi:hypothetical protein